MLDLRRRLEASAAPCRCSHFFVLNFSALNNPAQTPQTLVPFNSPIKARIVNPLPSFQFFVYLVYFVVLSSKTSAARAGQKGSRFHIFLP